MGGNIFKDTNVRLSAADYKELELKLLNSIPDSLNIPHYRNKQSHGDIDLLVLDHINVEPYLKKAGFHWLNKSVNGNVHSYALKTKENKENTTFQLDIIKTPIEYMQTSQFYFSYNDLNNLVGKIARQFDLSFGFKGLYYVYSKEDRKNKFLLTQDPQTIYEFLGLDWFRYQKGFIELTDIFDFVVDSKYFSTTYFTLESLNHKHRKRDRVRHTYHSFLNYIKDTKTGTSVPIIPFDLIESTFSVSKQIHLYEDWLEKKKYQKLLWNGYVVLEKLPDIDKLLLPQFMNYCIQHFAIKHVETLEDSEMSDIISDLYEHFLKTKDFR